jgi:hypothetical protein
VLVRPGLQHDRVALGQAPVDNDWVAPASADWWNRSEVELGLIARQVLLGRAPSAGAAKIEAPRKAGKA